MTTSAMLNRMCQSSGVGAFCSSAALDGTCRERLAALVTDTVFVERGSALLCQGDDADALFWIRSGAFKSTRRSICIPNAVTGFWLPGDLVGLDAFSVRQRTDTLMALISSEVSLMPVTQIKLQAEHDPGFMDALLQLLSREAQRCQEHMLLIAGGSSEQRVALFLIALIARTGATQRPDATFDLYMTREEIAAFLGLRMETVTRRLREFHHRGVIALSGRRILVRDLNALAVSGCVAKPQSPGQLSAKQQENGARTLRPRRASSTGHGRSY